MHELGIARGILDAVLDVAAERSVREVRVNVGALHGVAADSLAFGFQLMAEETPAANARLSVTPVPARTRCAGCHEERELRAMPPACAGCGSISVTLTGGRELRVHELVLEGPPPVRVAVDRDVDEGADGHVHDHPHDGDQLHWTHGTLATGVLVEGSWPFD